MRLWSCSTTRLRGAQRRHGGQSCSDQRALEKRFGLSVFSSASEDVAQLPWQFRLLAVDCGRRQVRVIPPHRIHFPPGTQHSAAQPRAFCKQRQRGPAACSRPRPLRTGRHPLPGDTRQPASCRSALRHAAETIGRGRIHAAPAGLRQQRAAHSFTFREQKPEGRQILAPCGQTR